MILPLGLFIGTLLSLGRLYAESEMVVLRACGVGPGKLATYIMVPALVVMSCVGVLSAGDAEGSARAQVLLDNPRSAEGLHLLNEGRFRKQRRGDYVTYTERIDDSGLMHNIFVFERQPGAPLMPSRQRLQRRERSSSKRKRAAAIWNREMAVSIRVRRVLVLWKRSHFGYTES